eukprot:CAMPEP_0174911412 /NCGR_PEP_ID=MMETSP0167-20121228/76551_1 /TAXON_ID=38298 /ORGANISM="Rhodella maculata, Strain CCMP736" /LENGTH=106 /DNA_ID=CAMNT_0016155901 /DNA_START=263 /DNA_END=581 /DNA_ORIENTATION=+
MSSPSPGGVPHYFQPAAPRRILGRERRRRGRDALLRGAKALERLRLGTRHLGEKEVREPGNPRGRGGGGAHGVVHFSGGGVGGGREVAGGRFERWLEEVGGATGVE